MSGHNVTSTSSTAADVAAVMTSNYAVLRKLRKPLIASLLTSVCVNLLVIVSLMTDHWELVDYNDEVLILTPGIDTNSSILDSKAGFYVLVLQNGGPEQQQQQQLQQQQQQSLVQHCNDTQHCSTKNSTAAEGISRFEYLHGDDIRRELFDDANYGVIGSIMSNRGPVYLRAVHGGIWRACNRITDEQRQKASWSSPHNSVAKYDPCYHYITDFDRAKLSENAVALVRMQNSAASCAIVVLLCLSTSVVMATIGLLLIQVSACMVTGVIYAIAGVFLCFTLTIMNSKLYYMRNTDCQSTTPDTPLYVICASREITIGWSTALGWVSLVATTATAAVWLYLTRRMRIETSKLVL